MTVGSGIGHNAEARISNFLFTIGYDRALSFSVQQANITEATMTPVSYSTGAKELFLPTNVVENEPLVLSFLLSEDLSEWIAVYKWMLLCKNNSETILEQTKPCSLILLDSQNQPSVTFEYLDAFPTQLSSVQYSLSEEGNTILTSTAQFYFNRFNIVMSDGTKIDEQYTG